MFIYHLLIFILHWLYQFSINRILKKNVFLLIRLFICLIVQVCFTESHYSENGEIVFDTGCGTPEVYFDFLGLIVNLNEVLDINFSFRMLLPVLLILLNWTEINKMFDRDRLFI